MRFAPNANSGIFIAEPDSAKRIEPTSTLSTVQQFNE
jgi:hypothetical protein